MKIEIVSIGNELLVSDILDTNSAYISRCLREVDVLLTSKVTVGDNVEMIADVFKVALRRADVVLSTGGIGFGDSDKTRAALCQVCGISQIVFDRPQSGYEILGAEAQYGQGIFVEMDKATLICLPGNRRELAYLLETEVLPFLQRNLTAVARVSDRKLLRTVGIMESNLKQELADITTGVNHRITFDSFAGQTDIRIWVEAPSHEMVQQEIFRLENIVVERMGEHIFGQEKDLLEKVVLHKLQDSGLTLSIVECYTNHTIYDAIRHIVEDESTIRLVAFDDWQNLADSLQIEPLEDEHLAQWCRHAAESNLAQSQRDLSLIVYNNVTQGGIQLLVTLASKLSVSITQRSFGGHPENIHQWALTLALSHLRRWLLTHETTPFPLS